MRDKEWKATLHDWVPQSLESQTKHFQFSIFKPTVSQGLYSLSPFGHKAGGYRTIRSMVYNEGSKGKTGSTSEDSGPYQHYTNSATPHTTSTQRIPLASKTMVKMKKKSKVFQTPVHKKSTTNTKYFIFAISGEIQ